MKFAAIIPLACVALAVAQPSRAQNVGDFAAVLATAAEGVGSGVGASMQNGQSVFVSASGHARLPATTVDAYQVEVSTSAATAVEAAAQRDAMIQKLTGVAKSFGATSTLGSQSISLGEAANPYAFMIAPPPRPPGAGPRASVRPPAPAAAEDADPPKAKFEAKATMRFSDPADGKAPAFLDALHAAGADAITSSVDPLNNPFARAMSAFSGQGDKAAAEPDPRLWDEAMQDAVRHARADAQTLATASGRQLGEARQVMLLWRSADPKQLTVTVAIRFALAPAK